MLAFLGFPNTIFSQERTEIEIKKNIEKAKNNSEKFQFEIELGRFYLTTNFSKANAILDQLKKNKAYTTSKFTFKRLIFEIQYAQAVKDFVRFNQLIEQTEGQLSASISEKEKFEWLIFYGISKQIK